ncbi:MAG: 2-oxo acid dehydrogenase subunit E2 [Actinobacteria bacterium]|nr:2-oxo acid dehydrogenase subunit E2 [Actinomycetota bacterium]
MSIIGEYKKADVPESRLLTIDAMALGLEKRYVKALIEVDVTAAREIIRKEKEKADGRRLSFTAWLITCIGHAVSEYPEVHSVLKRKKLYTFDDVDISTVVETERKGKLVPLPVVLRKANLKTVDEISAEILRIRETGATEDDLVLGDKGTSKVAGLAVRMPGFIRRRGMKWYISDPFRIKKTMGTVIVSSVGMFGIIGGWAIPVSIHPLSFAIGGIARKPVMGNSGVEPGEVLSMTILFDHDVVDGAYAARFTSHLAELMEKAYGLEDRPSDS